MSVNMQMEISEIDSHCDKIRDVFSNIINDAVNKRLEIMRKNKSSQPTGFYEFLKKEFEDLFNEASEEYFNPFPEDGVNKYVS